MADIELSRRIAELERKLADLERRIAGPRAGYVWVPINGDHGVGVRAVDTGVTTELAP